MNPTEKRVKMALQTQSIVPDVISTYPSEILEVTYPEGIKVELGNFLSPLETKDVPIRCHWSAEPMAYYTICMTDPDAPSRQDPKFREWDHWLVGNIPGCEIRGGNTLAEYIGPGPPKGTGHHRYVFLVYKQPKRLQFNEEFLSNKTTHNRAQFKIGRFAEKYQLGEPVAANFFYAEFDDYVPIMYKRLQKIIELVHIPNLILYYTTGNFLSPLETKDVPIRCHWSAEPMAYYTICMTDPDAPSRQDPKFREWDHWLVGNIPGCEIRGGNTLAEYIGPGPPKGTGHHRYVLLVYKQPKRLQFNEEFLSNKTTHNRAQFKIGRFAEKYQLGEPVAANFFYAEFDDYVPIMYKRLHCC